MKSILNQVPMPIFVKDPEGRLLVVNKACEELWGIAASDVIGTDASQYFPAEQMQIFMEKDRAVWAGRSEVVNEESVWSQKHQQNRFCITTKRPCFDESGKPLYLIGTSEDFTERKAARNLILEKDAQLVETTHLLQTILDGVPATIGYWNKDLTNRFANKKNLAWFGHSPAQAYGKHIREILGDGLFTLNQPYIDAALQGQSQSFRRTFNDASNQLKHTLISYVPDIRQGHVEGLLTLVTDISEITIAQQKVSESEARLRAILDNLPFQAWLKDREGRYIKVNRYWLQAAGINNPESIEGLTDADIWPGELAKHYRSADQDVMLYRKQITLTEHALDGESEVWTETFKTAVVDDRGQVIGTAGMAIDVTERHRAEEILKNYSERLNLAAKAAAIGICEWDLEAGLADWDEKMYEMFGIPPETPIDYRTWAKTILPEDLPSARAKIRNLIHEKQDVHFEFRIHRASDSALRYIQAAVTVGPDRGGGARKLIGVNLDITDFKVTETALRQSQAHLAHAQAQAKLGSWLLDIPSNTLSWSDESYRIFGLPRDKPLTYEVFLANVHPEDREFVDKAWKAAMQGHPYDIQHRIVVEGHVKWVRERAELGFAPDGSLLSGTGTTHDITELKQVEKNLETSRIQLRQLAARREKAREDERKRIAREVHDELGQLLSALRLKISMFRMSLPDKDQQSLDNIHSIMALLDSTIRMVRDVAASLRPAAIDMGTGPALEWLTNKFTEQSGVACELDFNCNDHPLDEESSIAIFRIVQESLTNVAKHAQASKVRISLNKEEGSYVLEIHDNGIGFDLSAPKKSKSFGLIGIGERAIMLGGDSAIVSAPGDGTLVIVRVPLGH